MIEPRLVQVITTFHTTFVESVKKYLILYLLLFQEVWWKNQNRIIYERPINVINKRMKGEASIQSVISRFQNSVNGGMQSEGCIDMLIHARQMVLTCFHYRSTHILDINLTNYIYQH